MIVTSVSFQNVISGSLQYVTPVSLCNTGIKHMSINVTVLPHETKDISATDITTSLQRCNMQNIPELAFVRIFYNRFNNNVACMTTCLFMHNNADYTHLYTGQPSNLNLHNTYMRINQVALIFTTSSFLKKD